MSGLVAERLFNLLPARMPLGEKYRLTEDLWRHYGPSSRKVLRVGSDSTLEEIVTVAESHIDEVVTEYQIPQVLEQRFRWLSADDIGVRQQLLNHLRQMEKDMVVQAVRMQLPVMLEHSQSERGNLIHRIAQVVRVGKHELEVVIDRQGAGINLEDPSVAYRRMGAGNGGNGLVWLALGAIALLIWFLAH